MDFDNLLTQAVDSQLFTAPVLGPHLDNFLKEEGPRIRSLAKQALDENISHFYWVGSGNSWVNLYYGKYLLDKFSGLTSDVFTSYEFVWRQPARLNKNAWVFLASYSGGTEDTVSAMRYANSQGARTIAFVNKADSMMGLEASETIGYNSKALYILPLAAAYLFALEIARLQGNPEAEQIIDDLFALPALLQKQYLEEKEPARKYAEEFLHETLIYTLGSGPLYGLAYKFGLTVFMENMRINGSFMDATEFRHGPVEMFDREKPAFVILLGTDESRSVVARVRDICEKYGSRVLVYDVADYGDVNPLLAPFILMIPLQWFAVWSTLLRGIEDLDERVLMGRGILGKGQGVTWP
jgi:fructoselysine-6-P-deglycase FrlB-like protein